MHKLGYNPIVQVSSAYVQQAFVYSSHRGLLCMSTKFIYRIWLQPILCRRVAVPVVPTKKGTWVWMRDYGDA